MENLDLAVPIAAVISGLLAITASYVTSRSQSKAELARARSEAMILAGVEAWKTTISAYNERDKDFTIEPLDTYILHMHLVGQIIFDRTTTKENIEERFSTIKDIINARTGRDTIK